MSGLWSTINACLVGRKNSGEVESCYFRIVWGGWNIGWSTGRSNIVVYRCPISSVHHRALRADIFHLNVKAESLHARYIPVGL